MSTIQENEKVTRGSTFYNYTSRAKKWLMVHKGVEINRNVLTSSSKQIVRGTWGYKGVLIVFVDFLFFFLRKGFENPENGVFF